jgi:hypothetical protein
MLYPEVSNSVDRRSILRIDVCSRLQICISNNLQSYPCNRQPIGLWDVEAPTFSLDSRLADGGEAVSLIRRPPFTPQEDSWYPYLLAAE